MLVEGEQSRKLQVANEIGCCFRNAWLGILKRTLLTQKGTRIQPHDIEAGRTGSIYRRSKPKSAANKKNKVEKQG
jgi:hypothetical protein